MRTVCAAVEKERITNRGDVKKSNINTIGIGTYLLARESRGRASITPLEPLEDKGAIAEQRVGDEAEGEAKEKRSVRERRAP